MLLLEQRMLLATAVLAVIASSAVLQVARSAITVVVVLLGPLIAFFVLRAIAVRLVLHYMMQSAPKRATESTEPAGLEEAVSAGAVRGTPEVDFLNLNTTN